MRRAIYITIMAMAIMTYSGKIHAQIGGLVIEAMVGDHQKSAYNLGVRSNVEFTNKELHNSSKKSSEFYKKVQDAYEEYMKLFDVLYTIIRGGATMYNVGTTISDIGTRVGDFKELIDTYYEQCLSHGSIASSDTLIVNVGKRMGDSIYKDAKEFTVNLNNLWDIAAYASGKAACKTTDLLNIFDSMNKSLDNIRLKIDAAYMTLWKYIMCRAYYWKPSLYTPKGKKIICSDAIKVWAEKAKKAISVVSKI